MMTRVISTTLMLSITMVLPAAAAERDAASTATDTKEVTATAANVDESSSAIAWSRPSVTIATPSRGAVLPALYVGFAALQAYDGYSTTVGLSQGARESNPVVAGFASHPAAVWALKGGLSFASIYVAERLWKQDHRRQAIAMMVVSNAVMAAVAARNASVLRTQVR